LGAGGFGFSSAGSIGDALVMAWAAGAFAGGAVPFANSASLAFATLILGSHSACWVAIKIDATRSR
jgi:hypothetical protein